MEDCCSSNGNKSEKGGKMKMEINMKLVLWIIIAILAIAVIYVLFFKGSTSGSIVSSVGQAAKSSGGMVGGC